MTDLRYLEYIRFSLLPVFVYCRLSVSFDMFYVYLFLQTEDEVFIVLRRKANLEELEIRVSDCGLKRTIEPVRQINPTTFVFKPSGNLLL